MPVAREPEPVSSALQLGREPTEAVGVQHALANARASLLGRDQPLELSRYRVVQRLAAGGGGVVYEGFDPALNRPVAIKVVHPRATASAPIRLLREARAVAQLSHPNVIEIYDVGVFEPDDDAEPIVFIVMELIDGLNLHEWIQTEDRPWRTVLDTFVRAGRGLAAAHAAGLVHRDFKPSNVLVARTGAIRVTDFGLACPAPMGDKTTPSPTVDGSDLPETGASAPLTEAGTVMGTPAYMAPEQHRGDPTDARSDQFSFCAALYEGLYRRRAYFGRGNEELSQSKRQGPPRARPNHAIPRWLHGALLRGLDPDPSQRWPSMPALLSRLDRGRRSSRTRWLAAGLTVATLAALGLVGGDRDSHAGCAGGTDAFAGVWDAARQHTVSEALIGTGKAYAEDTWERSRVAIDRYTESWVETRQRICKGGLAAEPESDRLRDLAMNCLHRRRERVRGLVDGLVAADSDVLRRAVGAIASLPALDSCSDPAQLRTQVVPPRDPTTAAMVERSRARLAQASGLHAAGKYESSHELASNVLREAQTLDYAPLLAEAWASVGQAQAAAGALAEAEEASVRAFWLATESRHDELALKAAANLVFYVGYQQARSEDGVRWGRHGEAIVARTSVSPASEVELYAHLGALATGMADYERASEVLARAIRVAEHHLGPESPALAGAVLNLGNVNLDKGRFADARANFERGLEIYRAAFGERHPTVGNALGSLATLFMVDGDFSEARAHQVRALTIFEDALGPRHPTVAILLNNLGRVAVEQDLPEEGYRYHQRALRIREVAYGPMHPEVAMSLANLGLADLKRGRPEPALDYFERSLVIRQTSRGDTHPEVAGAFRRLGQAHAGLGDHARSELEHRRALAIYEQAHGIDHPEVARTLMDIADAVRVQGRARESLQWYERVLALSASSRPDALTANSQFGLARALWTTGRERNRAMALARQAQTELAGAGPERDADRLAIEQWIDAR